MSRRLLEYGTCGEKGTVVGTSIRGPSLRICTGGIHSETKYNLRWSAFIIRLNVGTPRMYWFDLVRFWCVACVFLRRFQKNMAASLAADENVQEQPLSMLSLSSESVYMLLKSVVVNTGLPSTYLFRYSDKALYEIRVNKIPQIKPVHPRSSNI